MTLTLAPETEARLRAASKETGLAPEEVIDALLRQEKTTSMPANDTAIAEQKEQARLHAVMAKILDEAETLVPDPPDSPTRTAYGNSVVAELIAEKFRRQGFNV